MTSTAQMKEEFYVRRLFDDDVPIFVDATRYVRQEVPYPLSAKKALKSTCGVRTDNEVVAFSLRDYTSKQSEKEVENVESIVDGSVTARNLLNLRMPRKTLYDLNDSARELSAVIGDDVLAELNGELYVLTLTRVGERAEPNLVGKLTKTDDGYVRSELTEAEFTLPFSGIRLRIFLRSPVRDRVLAYWFNGYLTRKPGEVETVVRAVSLALNSILGLATFRMLSGLEHVEVPLLPANAVATRPDAERVTFTIPVLLFADDTTPAARGRIAAEIDLDRIDPVTGGLQLHLSEGDELEWNPALPDSARFEAYKQVLTETAASVVHAVLGVDAVRDIAYDIMLSDLEAEAVASLKAATADFPGLAANPREAEVRATEESSGRPAA